MARPSSAPLHRYANRAGNSGVVAYALVADAIVVEFSGGGRYLYDGVRPGRRHVARMRELALAGRGLASYINRYVGMNYRARLD